MTYIICEIGKLEVTEKLPNIQIIRWQSPQAPLEQELRQQMQRSSLSSYTWSNGPGDTYAAHVHSYEKVLYCVRGSIRFILPDQLDSAGDPVYVDLCPGDCMILSAGTRHSAQVGSQGVTCLEAARYTTSATVQMS